MKPIIALLAALFAAAITLASLAASRGSTGDTSGKTNSSPAIVERGRNLVHRVGMCIDCHSPRDEKGEFIESKHLTGSPLPFAPTVPMPWMGAAPRIAGLPAGFTVEDTVQFLMTGQRPNGRPPALPPMPPYRFDRADAEAITAFLHALSPGQ